MAVFMDDDFAIFREALIVIRTIKYEESATILGIDPSEESIRVGRLDLRVEGDRVIDDIEEIEAAYLCR